MRVNFLFLAGMELLLAVQRAFAHDYMLAGAMLALAVATTVAHFIRMRRFKRYDEVQKARDFD